MTGWYTYNCKKCDNNCFNSNCFTLFKFLRIVVLSYYLNEGFLLTASDDTVKAGDWFRCMSFVTYYYYFQSGGRFDLDTLIGNSAGLQQLASHFISLSFFSFHLYSQFSGSWLYSFMYWWRIKDLQSFFVVCSTALRNATL